MNCPAGKYPLDSECQWCSYGEYSNAGDATCKQCYGEFVANLRHTACIDKDGCTSTGGSVIYNQCRCPEGEIPNENGDKCIACSEGLGASANNMQCVTRQECGASVSSADVFEENGKRQCRCPLGYYVYETGGKYCSQCSSSSTSYKYCPNGINIDYCATSSVSNPGYTGCIPNDQCTNGSVSDNHCVCSAGYVPSSDGKTCETCSDGKIIDFNGSRCITKDECELHNGVYGETQKRCICQAGGYLKDSRCYQCPGGTISTAGSRASTDCTKCSGSADVSNLKHTACVIESECTKITGATVVDYGSYGKQCVCPVNQIPNKEGMACQPCPEGQMAHPGMLECITESQCQSIQSAQVVDKGGQKQCGCPAGMYFDLEDNICYQCANGYVSNAGVYGDYNSPTCEKCNGNKPYSSPDKTKCITETECNTMGGTGRSTGSTGSYCYCSTGEALDDKKLKCEQCTGQNEIRSGNGFACVCKDGYGASAATGLCERCPAGKYSSQSSVTKEQCRPCPEGTFSAVGSSSCTICSGLLPIAMVGNIGCVATAEQCGEHTTLGGKYNNQCIYDGGQQPEDGGDTQQSNTIGLVVGISVALIVVIVIAVVVPVIVLKHKRAQAVQSSISNNVE